MRTIFKSCALLSILSTLVAACEGGVSRRPPVNYGSAGPLLESPAATSPAESVELAALLQRAGAHTDALAEAHRREPNNAQILSAYGRQALHMGQTTLAQQLLRRALDADPNDWRTLSALAAIEGRQGRLADARLSFSWARILSKGNPVVLNNLGMSYLLEGNAGEAAALFRRALLSPELKPAHVAQIKRNLALALAVQGDFDVADRLAGEEMPRKLKHARRELIAEFVGMSVPPATQSAGWAARYAAASALATNDRR